MMPANGYVPWFSLPRHRLDGQRSVAEVSCWHELRVEAVGNKITCYYDGTDNTFKDAGKLGLWTKADSVTSFDNLKVVAK